MDIKPYFCKKCDSPFDGITWSTRVAEIPGSGFRQEGVEVPAFWSQLATNIVASKYFYKGEHSVRQLVKRVARTISNWGMADGYFDVEDGANFYKELAYLLLHQYAAFNSPVWFNCGLYQEYGSTATPSGWRWGGEARPCTNPYKFPQISACFIQSVDDNMQSIMDLACNEAVLFKYGSGSGTNLSTLRSMRENISNGGKPSGPLSFARIYDQVAEVVKSGGVRRAAAMRILNAAHPDIKEFIVCKILEERKAKALTAIGLTPEESSASLLYQNANLSVRVTDEFMRAVENDQDWQTYFVTEPDKRGPTYKARDLWKLIAESAHACGDPGLQFDTTINKMHTCPAAGRVEASNPCGEFMFLDDSACNLASLNLKKFQRPDGVLNHTSFCHACDIMVIAQDILVDRASYPTKAICENSHKYRPLGLGYTNLGAFLMSAGVPYDSTEAQTICSEITAAMQGAATLTSIKLAKNMGAFEGYAANRDTIQSILRGQQGVARNSTLWPSIPDACSRHGIRNAQLTLLAPTGTISFLMDCDTTGIEPDLSLIKYKQLVDGGTLKLVNQSVQQALITLGYTHSECEDIIKYLQEHETLEGSMLNSKHLSIFECAIGENSISWQGHLGMMAAAQPFLNGAISKTCNLPQDATVEDIKDVYMEAWKLGLKSVTVYRDTSKADQPLTIKKEAPVPEQRRERLPDTRESITHKFTIDGHAGYFTVGLYPDGRPGEIFISMAKEGSIVGGMLNCFGIAVSIGLQSNVPLSVFIDKFSYVSFDPSGFTKNPDIRMAKSIIDYIFRWLANRFSDAVETQVETMVESPAEIREMVLDAPPCPTCGALMIRTGACYLCHTCGYSGGCS